MVGMFSENPLFHLYFSVSEVYQSHYVLFFLRHTHTHIHTTHTHNHSRVFLLSRHCILGIAIVTLDELSNRVLICEQQRRNLWPGCCTFFNDFSNERHRASEERPWCEERRCGEPQCEGPQCEEPQCEEPQCGAPGNSHCSILNAGNPTICVDMPSSYVATHTSSRTQTHTRKRGASTH